MRSPHTSYRWREKRANQVDAPPHTVEGERVIEPIKWMRSPTPATGGEERES